MIKLLSDLQLFKDVIGQDSAKRKLEFYITSYLATRRMPNIIFVGSKGNGKTTLAKEAAKGLVKFDENGKMEINSATGKPKRKPFVEINCSTIKNVKQFINSIVIPYVQDKDVTLLFDEASELPHDVTMALLTILNPNPENRTTFSIDEYVCDFDFHKQTFIFATTEPQKVFHALLDRLERVDLEEYTPKQLATIVQLGSKEVVYDGDSLEHVATVLRGNARAAQKMAQNILMYLKNKTAFSDANWTDLRQILGINPLGVSPVELQILRYLSQSAEGTSLTCLSAKTGMSREALQKDCEIYLQRLGLMEIATTGRRITAKGLAYLKEVDGSLKKVGRLGVRVSSQRKA
jgi:Holliday junction resolvasome RuvABC ATP-dependent DNA helicase subunit